MPKNSTAKIEMQQGGDNVKKGYCFQKVNESTGQQVNECWGN